MRAALTSITASLLLTACGMKGDLYEPAAPPPPAVERDLPPPPESAPVDKGDRKTIPATPAPDRAE